MKKCPYCAEEIQNEAIKCNHCDAFLNEENFKKVETKEIGGKDLKRKWRGIFLISAGIIFIVMLFLFGWEGSLKSNTAQSIIVSFIDAIIVGGGIAYFKSDNRKRKKSVEQKKENRKRWIFLVLTLLTVIIPNIIAWQFGKEFVFGYPIGEEYGIAKGIAAFFALWIMWNYVTPLKINQHFKFVIIILSTLLPIFRLYVAAYLFFVSKSEGELKDDKFAPLKRVLLDTPILFIGFWSIYQLTLSVVPLLAQMETTTGLFRALLAFLVFYLIQRRYFSLNNTTLISFLLLGLALYFFPII